VVHVSRICLAAALGFSAWATAGRADPVTKANTVDDSGGALAGQAVPGLVVMNQKCTFGDTYHYQVTSLGELRLEGPIACATMKAIGDELICHLNPELRCTGHGQPDSSAPSVDYAIDESGVKIGDGKPLSWADPSQAATLLPLIRDAVQKKKADQ
jgi:hypothetical protein